MPKTETRKTHSDMLSWQYKTLIAELSHVTLHASDDSCPCNQVALDSPEYCLGKHLLNISSLASETSLMDDPNRDMLDTLSTEALEHHEKAKTIYCKGGKWPDLAQWSRDWRKKIEPLYYICSGKVKVMASNKTLPAPEKASTTLLDSPAQLLDRIRVTGSCKPDRTCTFKVTSAEKTERQTSVIRNLPQTIDEVLRLPSEKKLSASDRTFAYGTSGLIRYDLVFRIVDGEKLIVSNDPHTFAPNPNYPPDLQPRRRERKSPQLQVRTIAQNLNPDALLVDFRSTDRGAPIIGSDLVVESGNGRIMAIVLAASEVPEKFSEYKEALKRIAPVYALDPRDADKFRIPVLVRERLTKVNRKTFAEDCNAPVALEQSAIEKARTDAEKITPTMLNSIEVFESESIEDALRSPRNKPFVTSFLNKLPPNEQAKLVDAQGVLNQDGVRRATLGVFVATFSSDAGLRLQVSGEKVESAKIPKSLGKCQVKKVHEDGDVTARCDGKEYVITKDGKIFEKVNLKDTESEAPMKLLTKEIRDKLPLLYSQENVKDPMVWVKFFTPDSNWTCYGIEFDGKDIFFGYVVGFEKELGYFSLRELESTKGKMGLPIERDKHFDPMPLSEVKKLHSTAEVFDKAHPYAKLLPKDIFIYKTTIEKHYRATSAMHKGSVRTIKQNGGLTLLGCPKDEPWNPPSSCGKQEVVMTIVPNTAKYRNELKHLLEVHPELESRVHHKKEAGVEPRLSDQDEEERVKIAEALEKVEAVSV